MLKTAQTRAALILLCFLASSCLRAKGQSSVNQDLLRCRERVWRAWFAGDTKTLKALVPQGAIVISAGEQQWKNRMEVIQGSADFHAHGGKLIHLTFPRTEIQHFGDVAVTYSQYVYEIEQGGKRSTTSGRVTEVFVLHDGRWTNPGWHTDEEK